MGATDHLLNIANQLFRWLSPAALDLAEQLLAYDPAQRATAVQALDAPYFNQEQPPAEPPTGFVRPPCAHNATSLNLPLDCRRSKANGTNWRQSASAPRSGARPKEVRNELDNGPFTLILALAVRLLQRTVLSLHILHVLLHVIVVHHLSQYPRIAGRYYIYLRLCCCQLDESLLLEMLHDRFDLSQPINFSSSEFEGNCDLHSLQSCGSACPTAS